MFFVLPQAENVPVSPPAAPFRAPPHTLGALVLYTSIHDLLGRNGMGIMLLLMIQLVTYMATAGMSPLLVWDADRRCLSQTESTSI